MKNKLLLISLFFTQYCIAQSNTANSYIENSIKLIEKHDIEGAINTLNIGIAEMPDSVSLYDMRGTIFEATRQFEEAIKDYTTAISKTSDPLMKAHILANRGGTKTRIRDFSGAYEDLVAAVKLDSTNVAALNNLAAVCDEVNKPDETLIYLNQIIKIDSTFTPAYVNIGFKYQNMNEHSKAIQYFDKAILLDPEEALGYSNRSYSKLKTNDIKGAMVDINHSITLLPSNSYAYKIRALIYIESKNKEDACNDLDRAIEYGYTAQYGNEVTELIKKHCK